MAEDLRTLTFFFIAPLYDLRPNLPRVQTSVKRRGRNPYRDTPTSSPGVRGRQEPLFARLIGILTFSKLSCSSSCIYSVGSVHPTRYHPPLNPRCAYICASLIAPLILFILPPPAPPSFFYLCPPLEGVNVVEGMKKIGGGEGELVDCVVYGIVLIPRVVFYFQITSQLKYPGVINEWRENAF